MSAMDSNETDMSRLTLEELVDAFPSVDDSEVQRSEGYWSSEDGDLDVYDLPRCREVIAVLSGLGANVGVDGIIQALRRLPDEIMRTALLAFQDKLFAVQSSWSHQVPIQLSAFLKLVVLYAVVDNFYRHDSRPQRGGIVSMRVMPLSVRREARQCLKVPGIISKLYQAGNLYWLDTYIRFVRSLRNGSFYRMLSSVRNISLPQFALGTPGNTKHLIKAVAVAAVLDEAEQRSTFLWNWYCYIALKMCPHVPGLANSSRGGFRKLLHTMMESQNSSSRHTDAEALSASPESLFDMAEDTLVDLWEDMIDCGQSCAETVRAAGSNAVLFIDRETGEPEFDEDGLEICEDELNQKQCWDVCDRMRVHILDPYISGVIEEQILARMRDRGSHLSEEELRHVSYDLAAKDVASFWDVEDDPFFSAIPSASFDGEESAALQLTDQDLPFWPHTGPLQLQQDHEHRIQSGESGGPDPVQSLQEGNQHVPASQSDSGLDVPEIMVIKQEVEYQGETSIAPQDRPLGKMLEQLCRMNNDLLQKLERPLRQTTSRDEEALALMREVADLAERTYKMHLEVRISTECATSPGGPRSEPVIDTTSNVATTRKRIKSIAFKDELDDDIHSRYSSLQQSHTPETRGARDKTYEEHAARTQSTTLPPEFHPPLLLEELQELNPGLILPDGFRAYTPQVTIKINGTSAAGTAAASNGHIGTGTVRGRGTRARGGRGRGRGRPSRGGRGEVTSRDNDASLGKPAADGFETRPFSSLGTVTPAPGLGLQSGAYVMNSDRVVNKSHAEDQYRSGTDDLGRGHSMLP